MWRLRVSCASPWGSPDRKSAPRVSFRGNPDEVNPDRNACHVSSGGEVPTIMDTFKKIYDLKKIKNLKKYPIPNHIKTMHWDFKG